MNMQNTEYNKFFPSTLTLDTHRVQLRLMCETDFEPLKEVAQSPDIWKYFTRNLAIDAELKKWIAEALQDREDEKRVPFVIVDKDEKKVCGSTSFGNISFYDKRIEIGWTWLGQDFRGAGVNRQAKFALVSYAFDVMQMERVELKTDNLNERSKAALKKIGAKEEGILRSHMLMHDNRRRDSIYFSILKGEWPWVKNNYFIDLL